MVIATATSRDGDDSFFLFFSSDASNVLVPMRARDVERGEEEACFESLKNRLKETCGLFVASVPGLIINLNQGNISFSIN